MSAYLDQPEIAFGNLVDNSLEFTPGDGKVVLGLYADESKAQLWVEDSGAGIPPQDMARLFERFYRGGNAAELPGSGLGLVIVRALMDLHGGTVIAASGPNGSRFQLTLPPGA